MIYETFSDQETFEIGKKLAQKIDAGAVVCLDGDLGVGKTVFAKGFRGYILADLYDRKRV